MKKFFQLLCSLLFATSISCPAEALIVTAEDSTDLQIEEYVETKSSDDYQIHLLKMDLAEFAGEHPSDQAAQRLLFISDSFGKIVKDAQVVTTLVSPSGYQFMVRAWPIVGGYLVPTGNLPSGQYRVEVEAATNGQFVTDEFVFSKA